MQKDTTKMNNFALSMNKAINISEELNKPSIRAVYKTAKEQNVRVFVIGGWVRDYILNRESTDIDFV